MKRICGMHSFINLDILWCALILDFGCTHLFSKDPSFMNEASGPSLVLLSLFYEVFKLVMFGRMTEQCCQASSYNAHN